MAIRAIRQSAHRRRCTQMSDFGDELARLMTARAIGVREMARQVPLQRGILRGRHATPIQPGMALRYR